MIRSGPMPDSEARLRRMRNRRRPVLVLAACMALGMLVALSTQYFRTYSLARQAERLEQQRRDLVADNQALREEIRRLQTDDGYIEQLAREQLGLLKPGEVELQIVPSQPPAPSSEDPSTPRAEPSWPSRVWAFLESILRPDPVKKP